MNSGAETLQCATSQLRASHLVGVEPGDSQAVLRDAFLRPTPIWEGNGHIRNGIGYSAPATEAALLGALCAVETSLKETKPKLFDIFALQIHIHQYISNAE